MVQKIEDFIEIQEELLLRIMEIVEAGGAINILAGGK